MLIAIRTWAFSALTARCVYRPAVVVAVVVVWATHVLAFFLQKERKTHNTGHVTWKKKYEKAGQVVQSPRKGGF